VNVDVVRPDELGEAELGRWRAFQAATPSLHSPFLAPEFTRIVGGIRPRTRVGVLREHDEIVGFFPFERASLGRGLPVAPGLTDAQGLVHAPGVSWDAVDLLRACGITVWEFDHLVAGQGPFAAYEELRASSPAIDLAGGYDHYRGILQGRSPSFLRDLEKKYARLGRQIGPVATVLDERDPGALATLIAWKSAQYRRTGRSDRFAHPWIVELVERLLGERSDTFGGLLTMLYADGAPVAGHLGLRQGSVLAAWFPAYDTTFRRYSPGLLQHLAMAHEAAADGVETIDLGRGDKAYKDELKTREITVAEGRVTRAVPSAAVNWLRRAPVRRLRRTVLANPRLYRSADQVLRTAARARDALGRSVRKEVDPR